MEISIENTSKNKIYGILLIALFSLIFIIDVQVNLGIQANFSVNLETLDIPDVTDLPELESVGNWSDYIDQLTKNVVLDGNIIYARTAFGLAKFNITNPHELKFEGFGKGLLYQPYSFVVNENIGFFSRKYFGWAIYDISNISNCELLFENSSIDSLNIFLRGNILYLGCYVFNVTDPSNPIEIFTLPDYFDNYDTTITIVDDHLIASNDSGYFELYNISNPENIHSYANFTIDYRYSSGIEWADANRLLVNDGGNYTFYNISDINNIECKSFFYLRDSPGIKSVNVDNNCFYALHNEKLDIYNMSDLANPMLITESDIGFIPSAIAINGLTGYMTDDFNYLYVVNLTNLNDPKIIDTFDFGGSLERLDIDGKYVVIEDTRGFVSDQFIIINIEDPTNPYLVNRIQLENDIGIIKVVGDIVYIFETYGDLIIFDISNPLDVQVVGGLDLSSTLNAYTDCIIRDDKAFVLTKHYGSFILDLADPIRPIILDDSFGSGYQMEIYKNYLFVYRGNYPIYGVYIYLITDTTNLISKASISVSDWMPRDIKIYNDILYLSLYFESNLTQSHRLWTYNVVNPENPIFIEEILNAETRSFDMDLDGPYLYLSFTPFYTAIYNLTEANFEPCAKCPALRQHRIIKNGYILRTRGPYGLSIWKALHYIESPSTNIVSTNSMLVIAHCIMVIVAFRKKPKKQIN